MPIGSPIKKVINSAISTAINSAFLGGILQRWILQPNGTTTYATFDTELTLLSGDTLEIEFSNVYDATGDATENILSDSGGIANRSYIYAAKLDNTLSWVPATYSSMLLDDVAATNGVTPFPTAGAVHTIKATVDGGGAKVGTLFSNYLFTQIGHTDILSFSVTISGAVTTWKMDSSSTTTLYDTDGGNPITLFNVSASNWNKFKFVSGIWNWLGSLVAGSVLMEFEGTATTPTNSTFSVTGSTFRMNWEHLYVDDQNSYTYVNTPTGVPIRLDIDTPATCTFLQANNQKWTGAVPNLSEFTALFALSFLNNKLTSYTPSTLASSIVAYDLSGNDIASVSDIDQCLADLDASGCTSAAITLNGGTMAIPSAAGLASKASLEGRSCTVAVNA